MLKAVRRKNDARWYQKQTPDWKRKKIERQNARRRDTKLWVDGLKAQGCPCGERDVRCLDFDHVRGDKLFNISDGVRASFSRARLLREIEKCDLRCANCHRKRHA